MYDLYDACMIMDEGAENEEQYRKAVQTLIDTGAAWTLQGRIGRAASDAIDSGLCILAETSHNGAYGNVIPGRNDVVPGTLGSIEYARKQRPDLWPEVQNA